MLVGQVVGVDIFRPGSFQEGGYIGDRFRFRCILNDQADRTFQIMQDFWARCAHTGARTVDYSY